MSFSFVTTFSIIVSSMSSISKDDFNTAFIPTYFPFFSENQKLYSQLIEAKQQARDKEKYSRFHKQKTWQAQDQH